MSAGTIGTIGILTGGGDSSGINAAIRSIVKRSASLGIDVKGITGGWGGAIRGAVQELNLSNTKGIIDSGGTMLGTSRVNPFRIAGGYESIIKVLEVNSIDALIVLGGDDTLGVASRLYAESEFPVVGIGQSIDNDIEGTEYCIGYDTAVSNVVDAITNVRTSCESHRQDIVIEVMGRETGWIAAAAAVAAEAEYCLVPEIPFDLRVIGEYIAGERKKGRLSNIIVASEGCFEDTELRNEPDRTDAFGHPYLSGIGYHIKDAITAITGSPTRVMILGYLQRGGHPTFYETLTAARLGFEAVEMLMSKDWGCLAAVRGSGIVPVPLTEIAGKKRYLQGELLELVKQNWYGAAFKG